jgi:hypothetical protein
MAITTRREEVAFPSSPDPRFGGNLARANVGKQYSRAFPGGPPGVDRRYENYQAPHRVDYTSNVPRQTGTPNFRGPDRGSGSYLANKFGRDMDGGGGGLESLQSKVNLQEIMNRMPWLNPWRLIQDLDARGIEYAEMGGYGYSPNPYDDDEYGPFVPPSVIDMDLEGIGYDPADEYDFDRKKGYPGRKFGRGHKGPVYSARGGLMSLRR